MAVCDICSAPGRGTIVSAEQMREAVFGNGFNPFALGLAMTISGAEKLQYQNWKTTIVAQDTSDWNICPTCMTTLKGYLETAPEAAGVTKATVSTKRSVAEAAGAAAARKHAKPQKSGSRKKWWQFWK